MAGADINAKDIDGNTPCHFCSEYGHKDCLRWLLLKHPSLFSKNKEGLSPLDVAVNTEILQVSQTHFRLHFLANVNFYFSDFPRLHPKCQEHLADAEDHQRQRLDFKVK